VPAALLVVGPLALGAHLLLTRTVLGRWLYAVGGNPRTARVSGVPVERVVLLAYVACAACAAVASILYTARLETGSPVLGQRILLDVIGAVVIGGTSLFGGRGTILGTFYGALFITLLDNGLNLMGLSSFTVLMVKGAVILAAALVDAIRERVEERR
jgi:ribose/xylose/arabinose/galactoside ABC-type transport system permease subunit